MSRTPYQWNAANFKWNENIYTWDDCALIIDIVTSLGGGSGPGYDNLIPSPFTAYCISKAKFKEWIMKKTKKF